jgi:hypothetical protein
MGVPTVQYKQVHSPSPRIKGSLQGLSATVRYRVAWADAFTFTNQVLGLVDGSPWHWPASPNMRATEANIEPVAVKASPEADGSTPGTYYRHAFVDVTFNSVVQGIPQTGITEQPPANQFDPSNPIEMSSYQIQYGVEPIKLPAGSLSWMALKADLSPQDVPANVPLPGGGSDYMMVPTFNLNLTMHNCLQLDSSTLVSKLGKINDSKVFSICDVETLLLQGITTNRREMSSGQPIIDATLNYKWRQVGWNMAMGMDGNLYRYGSKSTGAIYKRESISPLDVIKPATRWRPGI